ncbi:hypothetical protein R3P38DRAFT_2593705 [Favolaschia claudopus]|uniref:DUF6535 domain-containing protein n=1 Tax=Favolaschia claudopus TaxID=2862362 RepID=A0AAW0EGR1_9AGAR
MENSGGFSSPSSETSYAQTNVKIRDDDPSETMWSVYMNQVERHNKVLVECWKADMNSILIFAGLFSGSLTTFLVESYSTLSPPKPPDPTQAALLLALQQLVSQSTTNYTLPVSPSSSPPFSPPTSALICNILWFLSLGFSLSCALSATLVDQWARNYILATESRPSLHKRARISAYLHRGVQRFHMNTVVELIPTLLHISLLLFFAGLVEFLQPINTIVSNLMLGMLLLCGTLYLLITFLPIFYSDCPYRTPISSLWWRVLRGLGNIGRRDLAGSKKCPPSESMADARDAEATQISHERDERDFEAMHWTMSTLREDSELEPFLGFVPRLVAGFDYSAKLLLHRLLNHDDPTIGLRYRIPRLLSECAEGRLQPVLAHDRATTCLHAIWSLTMLTVPLSEPFSYTSRDTLSFDENTLSHIHAAAEQVPSIADCAESTASVVARNLLDMFVDSAEVMEAGLATYLRTGHWFRQGVRRNNALGQVYIATKRIKQQLYALEQLLEGSVRSTTPILHVGMENLRRDLDKLLDVVASTEWDSPDRSMATEALGLLRTFQRLQNNAGLTLTLDYVSILVHGTTLPHEAFNTLRRLFLKNRFGNAARSPQYTQSRLVLYLDEALEQNHNRTTPLPPSIINILLRFAGSAIDDPGCAMKAKAAVTHYLNMLSPEDVTRDEALHALERLNGVLPWEARAPPASELLSAHLYANTRIEKTRRPQSLLAGPVLAAKP